MVRKFAADQLTADISIVRSDRRTVSIEIRRSGIVVRAPLGMSDREIEQLIESKKAWIEKHLERISEQAQKAEELPPLTHEELRALGEKAVRDLPGRVAHYAAVIGVDYGRITIRSQRTLWGSCSGKGNLSFNCLLMLMPDDVIDSVVVHELCHRKHPNHSPRFYAEVEKAFPDYRRCHQWLKEHGGEYLKRLP